MSMLIIGDTGHATEMSYHSAIKVAICSGAWGEICCFSVAIDKSGKCFAVEMCMFLCM